MPLDLLLNSTLAAEESLVVHQTEPIGLDECSESLAIAEKRCSHLASLLAESEANEARLSQLADALKEEIRRTERAEERQKHIENLEYLKNVVLKVCARWFLCIWSSLIGFLTIFSIVCDTTSRRGAQSFGSSSDDFAAVESGRSPGSSPNFPSDGRRCRPTYRMGRCF